MSKQQIHEGRNWYAIHTYAGYENAVPEEALLMREYAFDSGHKVGDEYQYGVELTRPQGFTTAASGVLPSPTRPLKQAGTPVELRDAKGQLTGPWLLGDEDECRAELARLGYEEFAIQASAGMGRANYERERE